MTADDEVIEVYLELRRQGMGEKAAARFLGTTHREIAAYAAANPDFAMALEDALAERLEKVAEAVYRAAQDGDMTAAKQVLESHAPAEWTKPTPEMILKVRRDEPLTLEEVSSLRERLERAARKEALDAVAVEVDGEEVTHA